MKTDLATTVLAAAAGFAVAFLVTNIFVPGIADVSFKELSGEITYELTEPDVNVFNFRALNPTVEVYVGNQNENENQDENQNQTQIQPQIPDQAGANEESTDNPLTENNAEGQ